MNRRLTSLLIFCLFIVLPLLTFFQNCGSGHGGGDSSASAGADQQASAWPLKLSGNVDPDAFDLSSDGGQIVFLADREISGREELYMAQRNGSGVVKLSGGGEVYEFRLLEDKVVYLAEETAGRAELFAVDLDGGNRRSLSGAMVAGGQVLDFDISPDGLNAVFRADKDTAGVAELYVSALSGNTPPTPLKLHMALSAGQGIEEFRLLNTKVVFRGTILRAGEEDLYSVHLDGSLFLKISANNVSGGQGVVKFQTDTSGAVIVYTGDLDALGRQELYQTDIDGVNQRKLNQTPVAGGGVVDFELTEQAQDVVYLGNLDAADQRELYHRDLVAFAPPNKLNPPLVRGGNVSRFSTFERMTIVSGSPVLVAGVSMVADADLDDQFELYTSADLNSVAAKANGTMGAGGDILQYAFNSDVSSTAYIADQDKDGRFELYSKTLTSLAAPLKIVPMAPGRSVVGPLMFTPDGAQILYVADVADLHQRDLWSVSVNGGAPVRVSASHVPEASILAYKLNAGGNWVAYAGEQSSAGVIELFIAPNP